VCLISPWIVLSLLSLGCTGAQEQSAEQQPGRAARTMEHGLDVELESQIVSDLREISVLDVTLFHQRVIDACMPHLPDTVHLEYCGKLRIYWRRRPVYSVSFDQARPGDNY
jgi:hypothetical protein